MMECIERNFLRSSVTNNWYWNIRWTRVCEQLYLWQEESSQMDQFQKEELQMVKGGMFLFLTWMGHS